MKTVEGQLDETLMTDHLIAMLSAGFGLLATVLASVGLYGVMAFVVARRRKELGLRLALGAEPGQVIWIVMREVLTLLAIGLAVGLPAAIGLGRFVASQLYGIEANDPWMAIATMVLLGLVSAAAGLHPGAARQPHRPEPGAAHRIGERRSLESPRIPVSVSARATALSTSLVVDCAPHGPGTSLTAESRRTFRVGVAYAQRPGANVVPRRWTRRLRHPSARETGRGAAGTAVAATSCRHRRQRRHPGRRAVPAGVRVLPRRVGPRRHARSRSHDRRLEPRRLGRGAGRHDQRRRAWHRDGRPRPPDARGDRADRRLPAHAAAARHPVPGRRRTRGDAVLRRRALRRVPPREGPRRQGRPGAHHGGFGAVARLSHRVHSRARALPDRARGDR